MKSLFVFITSICLTVLLNAQQPGSLDQFFGESGTIKIPLTDYYRDQTLKVTKEGRILIGTTIFYKDFHRTFQIDALLPDGSIDSSFDQDGIAHAVFSTLGDPILTSLTLLPDGRILAVGPTTYGNEMALARFMPDGKSDSSFGTNGTASALLPCDNINSAGALALQPDGKILVGGTMQNGNLNQLFTIRFKADGSKDLSFGNKSLTVGKAGEVFAIAVQKNGKIVSAGYSGAALTADDARFHIERYNEDGSYDESFGKKGVVDIEVNGNNDGCFIRDIAIQDDGKLVVTGVSGMWRGYFFTVARFNADGTLDKSFGKDGVVTTSFGEHSGEGRKVLLTGEHKDKIVVAGTNRDFFGQVNWKVAVAAYNMDGTPDTQFAEGGVQTNAIDVRDVVNTADLQPNGKIVVIGTSSNGAVPVSLTLFLARYNGYPTQVPLFVRIKRWLNNHGISWKGLPQDNIAYYSIQQSKDGRTDFTQIAKLSGVSNLREYNYTNSNLLLGTNYYRIKAVSSDGTIRYSEVASADNNASTASVYPNPVRDYVTVQGLKTAQQANISIANTNGTVLAKGVSNGSTQYSAPATNLQPGTYYLNITSAGKTETLKFVKE